MPDILACMQHARAITTAAQHPSPLKRDCKTIAKAVRRVQDLLVDQLAASHIPGKSIEALADVLAQIEDLVLVCCKMGPLRAIVHAGELNERFAMKSLALSHVAEAWKSADLPADFRVEAGDIDKYCRGADFANTKALMGPSAAMYDLVNESRSTQEKKHKAILELLLMSTPSECNISAEGLKAEARLLHQDAAGLDRPHLSGYLDFLADEVKEIADKMKDVGCVELQRQHTQSLNSQVQVQVQASLGGKAAYEKHSIEEWLQGHRIAMHSSGDEDSHTSGSVPSEPGSRAASPQDSTCPFPGSPDISAAAKASTTMQSGSQLGRHGDAHDNKASSKPLSRQISTVQMQLASSCKNDRVVALIQFVSLVKTEPAAPSLISKSGLLMSVVEQLRTGDMLLKVMALKALDAVAAVGNTDVSVVVAASGCVQLIVNTIDSCTGRDSDLLQQGLQILHNLARTATVRPLLVGCGVLPPLIQLLGVPDGLRPGTFTTITSVLTQLAEQEQVALNMVEQYDVLGFLLPCLTHPDSELRSRAVSLLSALGCHAEVERTLQAAAGVTLCTLCKLLADDNESVRHVAVMQLSEALGRSPELHPTMDASQTPSQFHRPSNTSSLHMSIEGPLISHPPTINTGPYSSHNPHYSEITSSEGYSNSAHHASSAHQTNLERSLNSVMYPLRGLNTGDSNYDMNVRSSWSVTQQPQQVVDDRLAVADHVLAQLALPTGALPADVSAMLQPSQESFGQQSQGSFGQQSHGSFGQLRKGSFEQRAFGPQHAQMEHQGQGSFGQQHPLSTEYQRQGSFGQQPQGTFASAGTGSDYGSNTLSPESVQSWSRSQNQLFSVSEHGQPTGSLLRSPFPSSDLSSIPDTDSIISSLPPSVVSLLSSSSGFPSQQAVQELNELLQQYQPQRLSHQRVLSGASSVNSVASRGSTVGSSQQQQQQPEMVRSTSLARESTASGKSSNSSDSAKKKKGLFQGLGYMLKFDGARL